MNKIDHTHDSTLKSWIASANEKESDFPIQNLPYAVFQVLGQGDAPRCGVGIGDSILDVGQCAHLFSGAAAAAALACRESKLNALMALGANASVALRHQLSKLLSVDHTANRETLSRALHVQSSVELLMPARIGGFTDFFASIHHATNAGRLFRPDAPLLPNYKYVPVAYNGRANSVRVSGAPVRRPWGQLKSPIDTVPRYAPACRLDFEIELGLYIGTPSVDGHPIPVEAAWDHIFGFSLLNDWSARDIQAWEYQPLGPFLAKSFATTVSPWIITAQALAPFRVAPAIRPAEDPAILPHLYCAPDMHAGALSITIDASLATTGMRKLGMPGQRLARTNARNLYWTFAQMLAHHTSNGSALDTADLLGTGTISGPTADELGSLLEITSGGQKPLILDSTDEERIFLEDGDEITFNARCERDGFVPIGFGACTGTLST